MKKKYLTPEVSMTYETFEQNILSNGEDLNMRDYGTGAGEDIDDFWD